MHRAAWLVIVFVVGFFAREAWLSRPLPPTVWLEPTSSLWCGDGTACWAHSSQAKSRAANMMTGAAFPYFRPPVVLDLRSVPVGEAEALGAMRAWRLSDNVWYIEALGRTWVVFGDGWTSAEENAWARAGTDFGVVDWWVLPNSDVPPRWAYPRGGIIVQGHRRPNRTLRRWARGEGIPIMSVSERQGLRYTAGQWYARQE